MKEKNPSHSCMKIKISKGGTEKKTCPYAKMKEIKTGDRQKKKTSYPCMKMKISKGGTEKKQQKNMSLCKNERNQKRGQTKEKKLYPCMKMKISKRGTEETTTKKHDVPMRK
jgi:hypothetical protein